MTKQDQIKALLEAADEVYLKYVADKKYLYAKMLYKINQQLYVLFDSVNLNVKEKKTVILHYTLWFSEFEFYELKYKPKLEESFVFNSFDRDSSILLKPLS